MWFITHTTSGESACFLPEKLKYSIGRSGADVELQDDICVSRAHAAIHLVKRDDGQFKLELEDLGSKYGTFLNKANIDSNTAVEKGRRIPLKQNDVIRFGRLQNIWKVQFMNIQTATSSLNPDNILLVRNCVKALGGNLIDQWSSSCTHLTMKDPSITIKLLHALTEQKLVVTPAYWKDLLNVANRVKGHLPKPESYRPDFGDDEIDFGNNNKRRSLFKGTNFVFLNRKHYDMYSPLVKALGGACKDLNTGVQKAFLIKDKVVVIQYTPSTQTQSSQTINTIADFLESNSKRIIPEYEIGLAILHCSIEKYCNPSFKMTQTMTLPCETAEESQEGDIHDEQSTISLNTESMDLVISETNDMITSTPYVNPANTNPDSNKETVSDENKTETAMENCRKRKAMSIDLNESDDGDLFQFQAKKSCEKKDIEKDISPNNKNVVEKVVKTPTINVFLQKSQNKNKTLQSSPEQTEGEQPSTSKENRKRPLIQVLNEDDEGGQDDDLFSFGDTQKTKKARQQIEGEDGGVAGEGDELFSFKENEETTTKKPIRTIEVDEDSNDMEPTQQFIVVTKRPSIQMPKPKVLPRKISAIEWISSSLGKINIKKEKENNDVIKNENDQGNENDTENKIKTEAEIKTEIGVDITITEGHRKWLESLKDAIEIQQVSLNHTMKNSDKSHYKFKSHTNISADNLNETQPNFKRFVKRYHVPSQNNSTGIKLHLR